MVHAEPVVVDNPENSRFEVRVDDTLAGVSVYQEADDAFSFTHTEIEDDFGGQGLGTVLVQGALDTMRERHAEVLPYCPFVRNFIAEHSEYLSLVPAGSRAQFELDEGA